MLNHYWKQVRTLIRQEKLFSGIYIAGTALSIAVVMVMAVLLYVKLANIYPETNRDRLLYVKLACMKGNGDSSTGPFSHYTIENCFRNLTTPEAMTASMLSWGEEEFIQAEELDEDIEVTVKYVDDGWWKVYSFLFINGAPFTAADHQSGIYTAVISRTLARKVFGTTDVIGRDLTLEFVNYRICGVVEDVAATMGETYANVWIPSTVHPDYMETHDPDGVLGNLQVVLLAPSVEEVEAVEEEVREALRKYGSNFNDAEFITFGQPDRHRQLLFRRYWDEKSHSRGWTITSFVFLIVLLIPAVSLSGMIDSRMERRMSELGVRRTFGATNRLILKQIIYENLCFTLIGGGIGLLFSFLFLYIGRTFIFQWTVKYELLPEIGNDLIFSPEMLFNIPVFLIALLVCIILNILSAAIPAWRASRREIVYSLNLK